MSNAAVGPIYEAIIQEVVNAVRVDFEENGVDEGVLEDLKKVSTASLSISPFPVANFAVAQVSLFLDVSL